MDTVLVLDIGSSFTKIGTSKEKSPTKVFHTIVGKPRYNKRIGRNKGKDLFIGDEVLDHFGVVKSDFPVRRGVIRDWDAFGAVLKYALKEIDLNSKVKEFPCLISFPPFAQERMINRIAKTFFDDIGVPALAACSQPYLIKKTIPNENAVIVESGGGNTSITPLLHDRVSLSLSSTFPIAGTDITERLAKFLEARGYNFDTPAGKEIVRKMKEKLCYFSSNPHNELKKSSKDLCKTYKLPDGRKIEISEERFQSPEVLYQPKEIGRREPPLHEKIYDVIRSCDISLRPKIVSNIILSGGNSLLPGYKQRLQKELEEILPDKMEENLGIQQIPHPSLAVWKGGGIAASSDFDKIKTTKIEWRKNKTLFSA